MISRRARLILFWISVVLFLVTAPLVVLYTSGYRLGQGGIVRTGALSISTVPRSATISLNGRILRARTPTVLKNLSPKEHTIRLEREGFFPFEQSVTIRDRETAFFESVVLWADSEPQLHGKQRTDIFVNPEATHMATRESNGAWTEVWVEELATEQRFIVARFAGTDLSRVQINWSPDGQMLLMGSGEQVIVSNRDASMQTVVNDLTIAPVTNVFWDQGKPHQLLYTTLSRTYRYTPHESSPETILGFPVSSALTIGEAIFYPQTTRDQTLIIRRSGNQEESIAILPFGNYDFIESRLPYLVVYNDSRRRLYVIDADVRDQPILLNTDVVAALWAPSDNRLLYTNGIETHLFFPETNEDVLLARVSTPAQTIAWHPLGSAALVAYPGEIIAYDLNPPEPYATTTISTAEQVFQLFVDSRGRDLYFIGQTDQGIGLHTQAIR